MSNIMLSIIIPARNEIFIQNTIDDIFKHIEGDTEVIVTLDGYWPEVGIPDHERLTLLHYTKPIGQRAGTNRAVAISKAKYIMKCDAHCSFDQGFDVKMIKEMHDDWTMVPTMRNLWVFDWKCPDGHTRYQGPSGPCKVCGKPTTRDMKWIGKNSPQSRSYCFDPEPHFQYFRDWNKRPEVKAQGDITETMSLQGSCFMLTRDKYWELNVCDEAFGSWGSQGIEVAVKTWLSGGKVMCNNKTWYAHCFRTQGSDFGFPYEIHARDQEKAKKFAKDLFFNNKWPKAIHPLSWLVEKFWPVPGWLDDDLRRLKGEKVMKKGIVFFTDNALKLKIAHRVQSQLKKIGIPIVSASLKPMPHFGKNIHVKMERGYPAYFTQILEALKASDAEIIYLCEHDVLYPPEHFTFIPPTKDKFYYDQNWWKVRASDGFCAHWDANQVSGLVAYKDLLIDWYTKRLAEVLKDRFHNGMGFEPGKSGDLTVPFKSTVPYVDIRHGKNLTGEKWSMDDFRDKSSGKGFTTAWEVPGWGSFKGMFI
jgi:glycosyltransferase involved in cell wall biosynthesis